MLNGQGDWVATWPHIHCQPIGTGVNTGGPRWFKNLQSTPLELWTEGLIKPGMTWCGQTTAENTSWQREKNERDTQREEVGGMQLLSVQMSENLETLMVEHENEVLGLPWLLHSLRLWYIRVFSQYISFSPFGLLEWVSLSDSLMMLGKDRSSFTSTKGKCPTVFCLSGIGAQSTGPVAVSIGCHPLSFLPSSLLDWHTHPVNFKGIGPTP